VSSSRHVGSWMVRDADVLLASPVQIFPSESIINDVAEALDVAPGSLAGPPAVASHATVVPEYAVRVYEMLRWEQGRHAVMWWTWQQRALIAFAVKGVWWPWGADWR